MSNYIVLVKQVPDVTQIRDNAFDPESGTLIRSRLVNVINELDSQALGLAADMRRRSACGGRLVCLTMGPPMAEEVLRYCLSRGTDEAILLTDRALGGADTWATANPLACAIRKIAGELFGADTDYYVVAGMQSVDGDTAQVPPQVAEELGVPCVAYVTGADFVEGRFHFDQIVAGGSQTVTVVKPPAVITVARYDYPGFAAFARTREALRRSVVCWNAADVNARSIGVGGSKTRVIRVFPPGKSTRKCRRLDSVEELAAAIIAGYTRSGGKACEEEAGDGRYVLPDQRADRFDRSFEATDKERTDFLIFTRMLKDLGVTETAELTEEQKSRILAAAGRHFHRRALEDMLTGLDITKPLLEGQVWVVAEHADGRLHPATFELVGKARELADSLTAGVGVVLAGSGVRPLADELIMAGADDIYLIEHELLAAFDPGTYRKAVADCIRKYWPQIVLYAATPQGRMLAPMVSYRVECGLTADCTSLRIADSSRHGHIGILLQTRPALGGNVMATICTKDSRSQMATARPGVMKRLPADPSRIGRVVLHHVDLNERDVSLVVLESRRTSDRVDFDADVIVSGGTGMQSRDNYDRLVGSLCGCLRDKLDARVERGASRAAVERGFIERVHQVGQTGTAVGPRLYVALGISGAIQHMIGVANSELIAAVNSDPSAPIFKQCDYYVVASVEEAVPKLVKALEAYDSRDT